MFSIEYKQGRENVAVNALSRIEQVKCKALYTHQMQAKLLNRIYQSCVNDVNVQQVIQDVQTVRFVKFN